MKNVRTDISSVRHENQRQKALFPGWRLGLFYLAEYKQDQEWSSSVRLDPCMIKKMMNLAPLLAFKEGPGVVFLGAVKK
jgi:hypothetical protein